ncbi:hypothetical protein [Streptomyces sp. NPDC001933]
MLIDRRVAAPAPNMTLVRRVDEAGFKKLLFDTVAAPVPVPASAPTIPATP